MSDDDRLTADEIAYALFGALLRGGIDVTRADGALYERCVVLARDKIATRAAEAARDERARWAAAVRALCAALPTCRMVPSCGETATSDFGQRVTYCDAHAREFTAWCGGAPTPLPYAAPLRALQAMLEEGGDP